ncbi:MAG TPA: MFS transporter [Hyphomicrobiaceae bacterium]|nr:MFS transporter [Hyphomicrobiaceae bacterium]
MTRMCLTTSVLLPFAAGYYLSYLFRSINAVVATELAADLKLEAADLGVLTAIYFLVFAAVQLPFGAALDRHGPKFIQCVLLLVASTGALIFALADGLAGLVIGRALLALGVALALMAAFKAVVLWFPAGRVAAANSWVVMLGALGAVTATVPAEMMLTTTGWRGLFAALAGLSAMAALLVLLVVPDQVAATCKKRAADAENLWAAYRDCRFWRIAPLSAIGIGTSWSLQGLWVAPWLRDVDGLDRTAIVQYLAVMATAVCAGALLFGAMADRFRRISVKTELLLAATLSASIAAQAGLLLGGPVPSLVLWTVIAAAGAATVLSFAILPDYFPKQMSGRANAALNLLHVSAAFLLQSGTGFIIAQWPMTDAGYAPEAHQVAMAVGLCAQLVALGWFFLPRRQPAMRRVPASSFAATHTSLLTTPSKHIWRLRLHANHRDAGAWRLAATVSTVLCVTLGTLLWRAVDGTASGIRVTSAALARNAIESAGYLAVRIDHPLDPAQGRLAAANAPGTIVVWDANP